MRYYLLINSIFFKIFFLCGPFSNFSFFQFIFPWRIIASKCCVTFCHTTRQSAISTHISPPLEPPSRPHPQSPEPTPTDHHRALGWAHCAIWQLLMWTIFKVFIEFVTLLLLLFMFQFFGHEEMWGLSSPTRNQTCAPYIGRWGLNH